MTTSNQVWLGWALRYLYIFRVVVVGTCLTLAPIAWLTHVDWLLNVSLCVAIGELIESSYYICVLHWGERTGRIRGANARYASGRHGA